MWTQSDKSAGAGKQKDRLQTSDLFRKFCETSTIHGTFFWSESSSLLGKLFWIVVVIVGLVGSVWIIDKQFKARFFFSPFTSLLYPFLICSFELFPSSTKILSHRKAAQIPLLVSCYAIVLTLSFASTAFFKKPWKLLLQYYMIYQITSLQLLRQRLDRLDLV